MTNYSLIELIVKITVTDHNIISHIKYTLLMQGESYDPNCLITIKWAHTGQLSSTKCDHG